MATPNGLNPNFDRVSVTGSATVTGGVMATAASILAEVGILPAGSVYLSSTGSGTVWVMQYPTWTQLTIN